ncbi:hypothetical protein V5O48_016210 [Marasmius crinis-equi]|uniref:Uncharacterized protein n=1 Tax=Marasmius crinis-equi TaxID=585013 RepID=A0ABR3ESE4_9AGAR
MERIVDRALQRRQGTQYGGATSMFYNLHTVVWSANILVAIFTTHAYFRLKELDTNETLFVLTRRRLHHFQVST